MLYLKINIYFVFKQKLKVGFIPGFPKVGQVAPLGATSSKGASGGQLAAKEPQGGP